MSVHSVFIFLYFFFLSPGPEFKTKKKICLSFFFLVVCPLSFFPFVFRVCLFRVFFWGGGIGITDLEMRKIRMSVTHISMSHVTCEFMNVTYEWAMTHEWVVPHINEPWHIWISHVTYQWAMTHEWVMTHTNKSCHI